jgi:hypothetical protein
MEERSENTHRIISFANEAWFNTHGEYERLFPGCPEVGQKNYFAMARLASMHWLSRIGHANWRRAPVKKPRDAVARLVDSHVDASHLVVTAE